MFIFLIREMFLFTLTNFFTMPRYSFETQRLISDARKTIAIKKEGIKEKKQSCEQEGKDLQSELTKDVKNFNEFIEILNKEGKFVDHKCIIKDILITDYTEDDLNKLSKLYKEIDEKSSGMYMYSYPNKDKIGFVKLKCIESNWKGTTIQDDYLPIESFDDGSFEVGSTHDIEINQKISEIATPEEMEKLRNNYKIIVDKMKINPEFHHIIEKFKYKDKVLAGKMWMRD